MANKMFFWGYGEKKMIKKKILLGLIGCCYILCSDASAMIQQNQNEEIAKINAWASEVKENLQRSPVDLYYSAVKAIETTDTLRQNEHTPEIANIYLETMRSTMAMAEKKLQEAKGGIAESIWSYEIEHIDMLSLYGKWDEVEQVHKNALKFRNMAMNTTNGVDMEELRSNIKFFHQTLGGNLMDNLKVWELSGQDPIADITRQDLTREKSRLSSLINDELKIYKDANILGGDANKVEQEADALKAKIAQLETTSANALKTVRKNVIHWNDHLFRKYVFHKDHPEWEYSDTL